MGFVTQSCLHPSPVRSAHRPGRGEADVNQAMEHLLELKRRYEITTGRLGRPLLFALVGCSGMVVDLVSLHFLLRVASLAISRALAIWLAMTWNFWLNRRLTFSVRSKWLAGPAVPSVCARVLGGRHHQLDRHAAAVRMVGLLRRTPAARRRSRRGRRGIPELRPLFPRRVRPARPQITARRHLAANSRQSAA